MIDLSACYALVIILVFGMAACDGRAAVGDGPETAGATRDGVHSKFGPFSYHQYSLFST